MHNYFTSYHTPPTCFDNNVSPSASSQLLPCQDTEVFQMHLLVIQFKVSEMRFSILLVHGKLSSRGGAVGCITTLQAGRWRVRFPKVSLEFVIDIILPVALCPKG